MSKPLRIAAAAVLATAAFTSPAAAKVGGANGRIVFNDGELAYSVNPDGSDLRFLREAFAPRFSSDGSRLSAGAPGENNQIATALMNPDGSGYAIQSLGDPDLSLGCPAWEPGDAHLACEGWDENDPTVVAGMYRISVAGWAGLTQLTTNPYGGHDIPEDYSPDGARIAFDREDPARGEAALHVLDLETGAIHRIGEWQHELPHASWSPDGRRIVTYDGKGNLLTMRPDGTRQRIVPLRVPAFSFAFVPGWSPDGTRIVFSMFTRRSPHGTQQLGIYTAASDGSDVRSVYRSESFSAEHADWGPAT
jgi:Tol biopolymer transport system component